MVIMKKIANNVSWRIGGEAGDGILNAGLMLFAKSCLRGGLYVFATAEYPSRIRGGHNNLDVRISGKEVFSHTKQVDILVALNKETVDKHAHKLVSGSGIIYDGEGVNLDEKDLGVNIKLYPVPLMKFANECGGAIMRNTVALGATIALLDFDMELLNSVIKDHFGAKKGPVVVDGNIKAAKLGHDFIKDNFANDFGFRLEKTKNRDRLFISGNEAVSVGAVKAGCKFFSAYPMTPATSILQNIALFERDYDIVVKHTEDEIAAINMAIGASFAGARAMTATSGGGFALMVEGFGLAAQTETPLVVVEVQRPGPATGMATHSGQGDLRYVLHSSTDEFPRIIIAPGDADECFYLTIDAFNLADKYQMPVLILTDKYLGESYKTVDGLDSKAAVDRGLVVSDDELSKGDYKRYRITKSGISARSFPGQKNGMFVATSYEHDEEGNESEAEEIRMAMHNKRYRKFEEAAKEVSGKSIKIYGGGSDLTILGWGSTKGPILEAMKMLEKDGISVNYIQVVFISPFPSKKITELMKKTRTVVVENNKTSQLSGLIKENTGLDTDHKILKYDGRPFSPEDICNGIKNIIKNKAERQVFSREGLVEEPN